MVAPLQAFLFERLGTFGQRLPTQIAIDRHELSDAAGVGLDSFEISLIR